MYCSESPKRKTLSKNEAINLLEQGKDVWNQWYEEHSDWQINLSWYLESISDLNLSGYQFPKRSQIGLKYWLPETLDIRESSFHETISGEKALSLWKKGKDEWNKWVNNHEDWDVDFSLVEFPEGYVSFAGFKFPKYGNVYFSRAKFSKGRVSFRDALFGTGFVTFWMTDFGEGEVSFVGTQINSQKIFFNRAVFNGMIYFDRANFGKGQVFFRRTNFGDSDVSFNRTVFTNNTTLDFSGLLCNGHLSFSNICTKTVLDFSGSCIQRPIDFSSVVINYDRNILGVANNKGDSGAFRYLKLLAKKSEDYERVLEYFAKEKRSGYFYEIKGIRLIVYLLYDLFSNYGRSIFRPLIAVFLIWFGFSFAYFYLSDHSNHCANNVFTCSGFESSKELSASQTVPFMTSSKKTEEITMEHLYGNNGTFKTNHHLDKVNKINSIKRMQNVLSSIFLFLLGLGIRNRFRA